MAGKLNFIHLCDSAFISAENGNLNLIGIFDTIISANFPAVHPKFSLVVNVGLMKDYTQYQLFLRKILLKF